MLIADKRVVNIMKVYIERNNLQLELIPLTKKNIDARELFTIWTKALFITLQLFSHLHNFSSSIIKT